jgi:MtfA peptidase
MFSLINNWRNQRIIKRSSFTPEQWLQAFEALPFLYDLTSDEQRRLRELAILFCHRKNFEGAHDMVVTDTMRLSIALQACLPILNLDLDAYDGWVSIIIYPASFTPDRVYIDESGVEHHGRRGLSGEAWHRGPVILAWEDVEYSAVDDGSNLVIHEFAHKLDMQNGNANGFPPLHKDMDFETWTQIFHAGFDDLRRCCEMDIYTGIDCYAASTPAEFFAVLSEVFFMRPDLLQPLYPAVYDQLRQFYRQDPLRRVLHRQSH